MNRKSAQRIEQLTQQIKGNEAQTTSLPAGTTLRRKKNWHTATHQILAWPLAGDFKIQLVSPPFGWAGRSCKQQRPACGSSHRTCA
jgi:hypothetical protein